MKKLYCFDFDGTLTKKDSMFLFLKHYDINKFYIAFIKHIPLFVLVKLKLANAESVKKSFISSILKNSSKEQLSESAQLFFDKYYPDLIRENALSFIEKINHKHIECYLVTASLDIWTKPFAEKFGMSLIATEAEYKNNRFTGEFASINCNGEEKVKRIKLRIGDEKFDKIIAFGDTYGDKEMLNWADEGHFKFFHQS